MTEKTGMSKKAAIAGMAITSIAASSDFKTQIAVTTAATVAIVVQAWLDYMQGKNQ